MLELVAAVLMLALYLVCSRSNTAGVSDSGAVRSGLVPKLWKPRKMHGKVDGTDGIGLFDPNNLDA